LTVSYVFRPHHSTTYTDFVAYCYKQNNRGLSVGLSVTAMSPANSAEPIELPFELWTWVSHRNHVSNRGPDPHAYGQF